MPAACAKGRRLRSRAWTSRPAAALLRGHIFRSCGAERRCRRRWRCRRRQRRARCSRRPTRRRGGASRAGGADAAGRRGCGCSGLGGNGIIGAEGERLIGRAGARESSLSPPPPPATSDASRALSIHARPNPIAPARAEGCPAAARRAQRRASPNEGLALHGFCRGGSAVQETEGVPLVLALSRGGAESLSRARACGMTSRCALGSQVC